ncbi:hypothetical protein C8F01DRAFT_1135015 [Mycena amicta]|nr:hypothetical protein C8F01DRAFT_1135015 [Mycena amicta]
MGSSSTGTADTTRLLTDDHHQRKDPHPQLSLLTIDTPPSRSPFPSPSSSFLPPPVFGAHEFAMKPAPLGKNSLKDHNAGEREAVVGVNGFNGLASPSTPRALAIPQSHGHGSQKSPLSPGGITPTATSSSSAATFTPSNLTPPPSAKRVSFPPPSSAPRTPTTPTAMSMAQHELTSSRPAPQSPAPALSRRTSLARSASSASSSSRRASGSHMSGGTQSKRASRVLSGVRHRLSQSVSAADVAGLRDAEDDADADHEDAVVVPAARQNQRRPIRIRDFAFVQSDARCSGEGDDVPRACDPTLLNRRLNGSPCPSPASSRHSLSLDDDDDDDDDGWGGFGYPQRLSFDFSAAAKMNGDGASAADFARNFGGAEDSADNDNDNEPMAAGAGGGLAPGIYRAQFAFDAEGEAEMPLEEGQLMYVVGSGATMAPEDDQLPQEDEEGPAPQWAVAWQRHPPLVRPDLDVMDVHALIGSRTDAGQLWTELWAASASESAASTTSASDPVSASSDHHEHDDDGQIVTAVRTSQSERRALVPDSFIVLIRGEGEEEEDARVRLEEYLEWVEEERVRQMGMGMQYA